MAEVRAAFSVDRVALWVGLLVPISFLPSLVYLYGVVRGLGLDLFELPIGLGDVSKIGLLWLPYAIVIIASLIVGHFFYDEKAAEENAQKYIKVIIGPENLWWNRWISHPYFLLRIIYIGGFLIYALIGSAYGVGIYSLIGFFLMDVLHNFLLRKDMITYTNSFIRMSIILYISFLCAIYGIGFSKFSI